MSGVLDGQDVSAAVTNPAFIIKNANDTMPNVLGFTNPATTTIADIQAATNRLYTATGANDSGATGTAYNATAGTITNGWSHQLALTTLANKFDAATGHAHTGAAGDGPVLSAASLVYAPSSTAYFYHGTSVGGALNALNKGVYGARAAPSGMAASGGLLITAGLERQSWYLQGQGGAVALTGSLCAAVTGFSTGQTLRLFGCSDANTISMGGANGSRLNPTNVLLAGPIVLGLTPASGQNCVIEFEWDGANLQETFRT